MDAVIQGLVQWLVDQGALGVIIIGMSYWIWRLQGRLDEVQEQRVKDAYKLVGAAHALSDSLKRNTEILKAFQED